MSLSRELIIENAERLNINPDEIPESAELFDLVPSDQLAKMIAETLQHREDKAKFIAAADKLSEMINLKESPIKAVFNLKKIMSNPEQYQEELAPVLSLFTKNQ